MADFTTTQLAALRTALASGELRVTYDGTTTEYRSVDELERAIHIVEKNIAADTTTPAARQIVAYSGKGT